ncbi:MAG TPA: hypothetical protein EYM86_03020 [Flavobacteriales bacterium]|nr:hypothetical protein [Flavobacteriales bacterium]
MRTIRIGDKVQAFLDSTIKGIVVEIIAVDNPQWLVGGTTSQELLCALKLDDGRRLTCKMHELHHIDD